MNDTKFLGLCMLLSALIISSAIIWSTKANLDAMAANAQPSEAPTPVSAAGGPTSVTISGPVTLAPFAAPIPVILSTPDGKPIVVKDAAEKQWTR